MFASVDIVLYSYVATFVEGSKAYGIRWSYLFYHQAVGRAVTRRKRVKLSRFYRKIDQSSFRTSMVLIPGTYQSVPWYQVPGRRLKTDSSVFNNRNKSEILLVRGAADQSTWYHGRLVPVLLYLVVRRNHYYLVLLYYF